MLPIIFILLFKIVAFYEFDTKQRYIKDLVDTITYKVKITGVLTNDEYLEFRNKLNNLSNFSDSVEKAVILKKGIYVNGEIDFVYDYSIGDILSKGDMFMVYVKSQDVSIFSRIENLGVSADESKNIYYKAKAVCRVEKSE